MRFGNQVTMAVSGDITELTRSQFVNWQTVRSVTYYTETVKVRDDKQVLAEFLKLLDDQKAGDKRCVGLSTVEDASGNIIRIEKSWAVPDLR